VQYNKVHVDWKNEVEGLTTPILAEDLEQIEEGIAQASRSASESQDGNVELASPAEMTTGTDTARVPAVKTVKDYVTAAISGLGGGGTPASETAAGIVELSTTGEMTTGTDTARVPAVAKVAAYVTSAINTLSGSITTQLSAKADKSGSIKQFSDVSDALVNDGNYYRYDGGTAQWSPSALDDVYTLQGGDGRLDPAYNPQYYVPALTINEGDVVPSTYPVGGWVGVRQAAASLIPVSIGSNDNGGAATVAVTLTDGAAVGDYLVFALATSDEVTSNQTLTSVIRTGSGAMTTYTELTSGAQQAGTIKTFLGYSKVTTTILSGAVITFTVSAVRTHLMATVIKAVNIVGTAPEDTSTIGAYSSAAPSSRTTLATITTTNANDLAIMAIGFNTGTPTGGTGGVSNLRTVAGASPWAQIGTLNEHVGTSSNRGLSVFYRVLTTAGSLPGSITWTAADNTTGSFSGILASIKASF
jgi:hypothetical protein